MLIPPHADIQEAIATKTNAEAALRRLQAPAQEFGFNLKPDSPQVVAARRTVDEAGEALKRLLELSEVRAAQWQAASSALQRVEVWLRDRPGGTILESVEVSPPAPGKGEKSLFDQIENRRRRARELRAGLARIAAAPYPSGYCKARMREAVEVLSIQGAPSITNLVELDGAIEWPVQEVRSEVFSEPHTLAFATVPAGMALIAFLCKPALIAALEREIDSECDDSAALTH
jgi:hypothetical protein